MGTPPPAPQRRSQPGLPSSLRLHPHRPCPGESPPLSRTRHQVSAVPLGLPGKDGAGAQPSLPSEAALPCPVTAPGSGGVWAAALPRSEAAGVRWAGGAGSTCLRPPWAPGKAGLARCSPGVTGTYFFSSSPPPWEVGLWASPFQKRGNRVREISNWLALDYSIVREWWRGKFEPGWSVLSLHSRLFLKKVVYCSIIYTLKFFNVLWNFLIKV